MILASFTNSQIAPLIPCRPSSVRRCRSNLRYFGTTKAPSNGAGRPRTLAPPMLTALCNRLTDRLDMFQTELADFLHDEFDVDVTASSIRRSLKSIKWTRKTTRRAAAERNADLRDFYLYKLSSFRSYQLVHIDESGCDKCVGARRFGWVPHGVTPRQVNYFHRDQRF